VLFLEHPHGNQEITYESFRHRVRKAHTHELDKHMPNEVPATLKHYHEGELEQCAQSPRDVSVLRELNQVGIQ